MRYFLLYILLFVGDGNSKITTIAKANKLKKDAEIAFQEKYYDVAIEKYHYLLDSLGYKDESAQLNLAHSYYLNKDTSRSEELYQSFFEGSSNKRLKSVAQQQLGNIQVGKNQLEKSIEHFKQALRNDPYNKDARYDYELAKKLLEEQKKNQENQDNKDQKQDQKKDQEQQNKDENKKEDKKEGGDNKKDENKEGEKDDKNKEGEQNQDKQDKEGEKDKEDQEGGEKKEDEKEEGDKKEGDSKEGDESEKENENKEGKPQTPEEKAAEEKKKQQQMQQQRFKEMKVSPEKAKMILDAMKNQEKQYFQQIKKKPTQRKDNSKPDW